MGEKLGQNFLINKEIVKKIIESANLQAADLVLEIGPGKGILTEKLAKQAGKVIAIEIDGNLVKILQDKFRGNEKVEIVENDILKMDILEIFNCHFEQSVAESRNLLKSKEDPSTSSAADFTRDDKVKNCNYKLVANIPYYITAPIIRKFLESDLPPSEMILMVQKEVAERICANPSEIPAKSRGAKRISRGKPGKMSILAVSVQYYAQPEILFDVPRGNFEPAPEVDSAVISIKTLEHEIIKTKKERQEFFRVVRAGFAAKRKTLANNLANSFHLDKKETEEKIIFAGLKANVRAQELSLEDWKILAGLF